MEMQIEYPELRQIKNRIARFHLGRKLQGMKDRRTEQIEKLAQEIDSKEARQVLKEISARLKSTGATK